MRSVSQIYSEAVTIRNKYLQLTELNSGRSNSKLSILNLLTYVVAVCIHTYEAVLDIFQLRMAELLAGRINGTPDWYALTAKKFQYNPVTQTGDELKFNEDTMKLEYVTVDSSHRIVEKAAWQMDDDNQRLILKVAKANDNSNEINNGTPYKPLTDNELTQFKIFIQQIKFIGADIKCESLPADIIYIYTDEDSQIYYNDSYVTAEQALSEIQQSLIDFANGLNFNDWLYYQAVIDAIRKAEHIVDIGEGIKVFVSSYNSKTNQYDEPRQLKGRARLRSGYLSYLDPQSILTINSDNLKLSPVSKMDEDNGLAGSGCDCGCDCECCSKKNKSYD